MKNITFIVPGLIIVLVALGCGLLGSLGIVVKVDDINTTLKPKTAIADVQNGTFAVANYELNFSDSDLKVVEDLTQPSANDQILITFKVNRNAGGSDVERGKFTPENIKWMHVIYFKEGALKRKALKNMSGSVLLPNFRTNETEIPGALDITDGSTVLKGSFMAQKL